MGLVLVEWLDSYGCSTKWEDINMDVQPKALACSSVGWLLMTETIARYRSPSSQA